MPSTHKHIRSSTANKRPTTAIADGQIALNTNSTSPGLFFKDSTGATIIKLGPVHVGTTAPNVSPAAGGSSGNSTGEVWLDTSLTPNGVKIWNGSSWTNATPIGSTTVQGLLELATNAETQTGSDTDRAVTPAGLQSKLSDSTSTTSSTTIASSTAVKAAYDLADAALPKAGGTVTGNLEIGTTGSLTFEGSTADGFETTLAVTDPTADRTITLPNVSGTVVTTGDTGTVTSTMIVDGTIVDADVSASAEIAVSKLADGTARQLIQTDAAGTGVEWTSNIDIPGTLDVTSTATFDSIASHPLGSAAAPTITFTGDTNTGIYSPGADQVAISTGGSGRLFVDASGRVGVNATPSIEFEVRNPSDAVSYRMGVTASDYPTSFKRVGFQLFGAGVAGSTLGLSSADLGAIQFLNTSAGAIYTNGATPIVFGTTNTERLRITSAGLVGVGTSTPGETLQVEAINNNAIVLNSPANRYNSIGFQSAGTNKWWMGRADSDQIAGDTFFIGQDLGNVVDKGGNSARLVIDSSGRVGIGTTSPGVPLQVTGQIRALDGGVDLRLNPTLAGIIGTYSNHDLPIYTNGGEKARIDSSGRLLIGTSSAISTAALGAAQVQVVGTDNTTSQLAISRFSNDVDRGRLTFIKSRGSSGTNTIVQADDAVGRIEFLAADGSGSTAYPVAAHIGVFVDGTPGLNDMPGRLVFSTTADGASSPTERVRITSAGRVGIGTVNPGAELQVNGNIRTSGVGAGYELNDAGTKISIPAANSIAFATSALERVRLDNSGRLLVGTSSAYTTSTSVTPQVQLAGLSNDTCSHIIYNFQNDTTSTGLTFAKSRGGSLGTQGLVADSNTIGNILFEASDGTQLRRAAQISAIVDGTPGLNDMPGRIVLSTTADGASAPTERLRITSAGNVGIGTTSPGAALHVQSAVPQVFLSNSASTAADKFAHICSLQRANDIEPEGFTVIGAQGTTTENIVHIGGFFSEANAATANVFYTAANNTTRSGTERARIDSSGRLLVGTSSSTASAFSVQAREQLHGTSAEFSTKALFRWSNDLGQPTLNFNKSRGTSVGTRGVVQSADQLGYLSFEGDDGTNFIRAAGIYAEVDGTPGANDMPGRIVLSTTADGASSPTERLRITNDGVRAYNQPAPTSKSAAATLTVAELKTGIIQYTGAAATLTLPTGTLTEGGFSGIYTNMTFEWSVINTGSGTCTIGTGTAHTIVGGATIAAGASGRFASRRTAANTFVSYRLS